MWEGTLLSAKERARIRDAEALRKQMEDAGLIPLRGSGETSAQRRPQVKRPKKDREFKNRNQLVLLAQGTCCRLCGSMLFVIWHVLCLFGFMFSSSVMRVVMPGARPDAG